MQLLKKAENKRYVRRVKSIGLTTDRKYRGDKIETIGDVLEKTKIIQESSANSESDVHEKVRELTDDELAMIKKIKDTANHNQLEKIAHDFGYKSWANLYLNNWKYLLK